MEGMGTWAGVPPRGDETEDTRRDLAEERQAREQERLGKRRLEFGEKGH